MHPSRHLFASALTITLAWSLACSSGPESSDDNADAVSPEVSAPAVAADATPAVEADAASGKTPAAPLPAGMAPNLHVSSTLESFPTLEGQPAPTFKAGGELYALAILTATPYELTHADSKPKVGFAVTLEEGGNEISQHEWQWESVSIKGGGPAMLLNVVPSTSESPSKEWTTDHAKALDALGAGTHDVTLRLTSPDADPPGVLAYGHFTYEGSPGGYASVTSELEDRIEGKGKWAPAPVASKGGGSGGVTVHFSNNCANHATLTLTEPGGKSYQVRAPYGEATTVSAPAGTKVFAAGPDGSQLNQRVTEISTDLDGMTSRLCR